MFQNPGFGRDFFCHIKYRLFTNLKNMEKQFAKNPKDAEVGDRLVARGPRRITGRPDVEGRIVEVREKGRLVMVQEDGYSTPTAVNIGPAVGWIVLTVSVLAWCFVLPEEMKEQLTTSNHPSV